MNKRNLFFLALLLVLGGLVFWLTQRSSTSTLNEEETDFAIEDTSRIDKIFLADKDGHELTLARKKGGKWMLNGKKVAEPYKVNLLLETICDVEIKGPMPRKARETVIRNMASSSIKAEFYDGDETIKTVYVGGTTPDNLGTFMYIEGADHPYITHIPGFNGYLTSRFTPNAREWRSKQVFSFSPVDIQKIDVAFPRGQAQGYRLRKHGPDSFSLQRMPSKGTRAESVDALAVKRGMVRAAETTVNAFVKPGVVNADSLRRSLPQATVQFYLEDARVEKLNIYPRRPGKRTKGTTEEGFDVDQAWAIRAQYPDEVMVISKKTMAQLLPPPDRFQEGR